jgi:basic membrane lipoprotein Med (substrate-binding protein (PBP1-ABC) superfamily)
MSAQASAVKVGVIFNDNMSEYGFNWMGLQGLLHAESELDVIGSVYTSTDPAEIMPDVEQCVMDGNELCIGYGFITTEAISNSAAV